MTEQRYMDDVREVLRRIETLERAIFGNGGDSVKDRLTRIETKINRLDSTRVWIWDLARMVVGTTAAAYFIVHFGINP